MTKLPAKTDVTLPVVAPELPALLEALTKSLGVPREVLAADEQIKGAWQGLPSILKKIDPTLRDAQIAKMCVAVVAGLFDGAINYVWNASISALRRRVVAFGLSVVSQIKNKPFAESDLLDLKDAELLSLSLELNLINQEGFFLLDQCRALRNSFSAAHPSIGVVDEQEVLGFANRCAKYALGGEPVPQGVDIQGLIAALKAGRFKADQTAHWSDALNRTHDAQRGLIVSMLHGIYCDPNSTQETRLNSLDLCRAVLAKTTDAQRAVLVAQHAEYVGRGDDQRATASRTFFQSLGLLKLLNESEKHTLVFHACKKLVDVHQGWDNFHNEPPFAKLLLDISQQTGIPESAQTDYVNAVLLCAIGNGYGVSNAAYGYYRKMVQGFSPREVKVMFDLVESDTLAASRIKWSSKCRDFFFKVLDLIDPASVPSAVKAAYDKWMSAKAPKPAKA